MKGFWSVSWPNDHLVSLYEGVQAKLSDKAQLLYTKGCDIKDSTQDSFVEAIATAEMADVVVVAVGETFDMSGEAKSRANIHLPGVQEELIKALYKTGKPLVVLVMAGRPLIFNWTTDNAPAILYTWWLGSEAGHAMADVLFGDFNPSGKLPMTFPRSEGQIPVFYNYKNTGRPLLNERAGNYRSAYLDMPNSPRFAFGHGLSYTTFSYSDLKLSSNNIKDKESIDVSFTLSNTGIYAGAEIVQLYLRDMVASVTRPVKELKGFEKVYLQPGESKVIRFTIDREVLSFYNQQMKWTAETGSFKIFIGTASDNIQLETTIELMN